MALQLEACPVTEGRFAGLLVACHQAACPDTGLVMCRVTQLQSCSQLEEGRGDREALLSATAGFEGVCHRHRARDDTAQGSAKPSQHKTRPARPDQARPDQTWLACKGG